MFIENFIKENTQYRTFAKKYNCSMGHRAGKIILCIILVVSKSMELKTKIKKFDEDFNDVQNVQRLKK